MIPKSGYRFSEKIMLQQSCSNNKARLAQGEALREAGVAGCGLIRLSACHVEDELRSGRLVAVLTDWECTGAPPILAFYRKAKPTLPLVRALVEHLAAELRPYNIGPKS